MKGLAHGDWVVPAVTHLASWRTLAVWKEADLLKLPNETLPMEHAAVFRELCLAYRLLEDHGNLKVCITAHLFLSLRQTCVSQKVQDEVDFGLTRLSPVRDLLLIVYLDHGWLLACDASLSKMHALVVEW